MHVESIRYFRAVFASCSIRDAASILKVTPGTLSKAMQQLELKFETKLFVSKGRGILPTAAAHKLYASSQRFMEEYQNLFASVREELSSAKCIRLGTFEVFSTYCAAQLINNLAEKNSVTLFELGPGEIESALVQGRIDLGISYVPYLDQQLEYLRLAKIEFGLFARSGAFKGCHFSDLPFAIPITSVAGAPFAMESLDAWPKSFPTRTPMFKFELLETALQTTSLGLSVLFCPRFLVNLYNDAVKENRALVELKELLPAKKVSQEVYLVKTKATTEERRIKSLAANLRKIINAHS